MSWLHRIWKSCDYGRGEQDRSGDRARMEPERYNKRKWRHNGPDEVTPVIEIQFSVLGGKPPGRYGVERTERCTQDE
jgi:hypothetical protein